MKVTSLPILQVAENFELGQKKAIIKLNCYSIFGTYIAFWVFNTCNFGGISIEFTFKLQMHHWTTQKDPNVECSYLLLYLVN